MKIKGRGVVFCQNGKKQFLGPKESIKIQEQLGADIILAFDECTSPLHDYAYTKKSLTRTHKWAKICLKSKKRKDQLLYGIIQGGQWRDLRETSASFIAGLDFDGFAVGGSLGKSRDDMLKILDWTIPILPANKPRHLLGIGKIEDLFDGIERGVDTFDCVIPTREARHGAIWSDGVRFDILKSKYKNDSDKLSEKCACFVCDNLKIRKKDLLELFKLKDEKAARYATIHNVSYFNDLIKQIRDRIGISDFAKIKHDILKK